MVTRTKKVTSKALPAKAVEAPAVGRPEIEIDYDLLYKCATEWKTYQGAASFLKISVSTFKRRMVEDDRFRETWERGLGEAQNTLRRHQWDIVRQRGDKKIGAATQMAIHMSKHLLGETDKSTIEHANKDGEAFKIASEKPTEFMGINLANATEEELAALELISAARDRQIAAGQASGAEKVE